LFCFADHLRLLLVGLSYTPNDTHLAL
jgi:hypothetical protein